jgi:hypothetical protein
MDSTIRIKIKRGESFVYSFISTDQETGLPIALTDWSIESQIRDKDDNLVESLIVTKKPELGRVEVVAGATYRDSVNRTMLWPIGVLFWDVKYTSPLGLDTATETAEILVQRSVTRTLESA